MRSTAIDPSRKKEHPEEPWLWRRGWEQRRIDYSHARDGLGLLLFALAWNGVVWAIAYFVYVDDDDPSPIRWVVYAFAILGLFLLWGGLRTTFISLRYPRSVLLLTDVPQLLGRRFRARFEIADIPDGPVWTSLSCAVKRTHKGAAETLWSEEREIHRGAIGRTASGHAIPIEFELPRNAPETDNLGSLPETSWNLAVRLGGEKSVPAISANFPIPVFADPDDEPAGEFEKLLAELPHDVRQKIQADIDRGE